MRLTSFMFAAVTLIASPAAFAWKFYPDTPIREVIQWQDNSPIAIRTSGDYCFIPASEKNMIAMVLALYASQRPVSLHCSETEASSIGGIMAYRLHRIVAG